MITLALDCGAVGLRQNSGDLVYFEIRDLTCCATLHGNPEHLSALLGYQRFVAHEEAKETVNSRETTIACSNRNEAAERKRKVNPNFRGSCESQTVLIGLGNWLEGAEAILHVYLHAAVQECHSAVPQGHGHRGSLRK